MSSAPQSLFALMRAVDAAEQDYMFNPNNSVLSAAWLNARAAFRQALDQQYRAGALVPVAPPPPCTQPLPPLPPEEHMLAACAEIGLSSANARTVCRMAVQQPDNWTVMAVVALAKRLQALAQPETQGAR